MVTDLYTQLATEIDLFTSDGARGLASLVGSVLI